MARKPTPNEAAASFRRNVTDWVDGLERRFAVTKAQIAHRAGVRPSTLYRWFDGDLNHIPSHASVLRIANAFGVAMPRTEPARTPAFFAEAGVAAIEPPASEKPVEPNLSWWKVGDRALELAGYLPGDRVMLDQALAARAGDAVIAQVYDFERGAAETRLRFYSPPFLVTRTMDPALTDKADLVDGKRVVISGPIVRMVRDRDA